MFTKNLERRNSFLRLSCKDYKPNLINVGMNQILLRHMSVPAVMKQQLMIGDCCEIEEYHSRGHGEDVFIKMVIEVF